MSHQTPVTHARRLCGAEGLSIELYDHGGVRRIDHGATLVNLFLGNALEAGPTNLCLRLHGASGSMECHRLLGPSSMTRGRRVAQNRWVGVGQWQGIRYAVTLQLSHQQPCWFWHVDLENTNDIEIHADVIYTQDIALAPYGTVRMNEYYVSQYVDHTPLEHAERGWVIASRQNLPSEARNAWCLIGSMRRAVSFATDALQVHGLSQRGACSSQMRDLPSARLQHEHSLAALQDERLQLAARGTAQFGFFGVLSTNHPEASSPADLAVIGHALELKEALYTPLAVDMRTDPATPVNSASWFTAAPALNVHKPDSAALRALFPGVWRHKEADADGAILSFFYGENRHVVMRDKELQVQRPHGHLLRTGRAAIPDERALTSTVWMAGVFNSMLTQGHVSINRLLSTVHGYLGLFRSHGQRVFVDVGQGWRLLDVPSAFEMSPTSCRWIYLHAQGQIEVRTEAHHDPHELKLCVEVRSGAPVRCLIAHHVALNGDDGSDTQPVLWSHTAGVIELRAAPGTEVHRRFPHGTFEIVAASGTRMEKIAGDELLFVDGNSRQQPYLCLITAPATAIELHLRGRLLNEETTTASAGWNEQEFLPRIEVPQQATTGSMSATRLVEILPWFTHNALIHYLSPRGLEQYSGGGWGTRDVTQGPVELLLALSHVEAVRDLLARVMSAQNPDGDWPQWFMFFERERAIRANDSHGDIVFWPLLALAQYLIASGDAAFLEERVPFYANDSASAGTASIWDHALRALGVIRERVIAGTSLAAYGHGDWNDSLQPADPAMREHMCSAWTVTLHHQVLNTLARALRVIGRVQDAQPLEEQAVQVRADFQRRLVVDDVLTGYALFDDQDRVRYLLHPRDNVTGVRYSALAMIHAILEGMLTPDQMRSHLALLREHLSGPDGVRLFDRPLPYRGGPMRLFQRAESATFFGREIGLMYMHAHLRYAQALAYIGETDAFFDALCQANPIGMREIVPTATLRQANCYYSSSDAAFADRYEASARYGDVAGGRVALDGGWRVYSSGAGIAVGLIVRRFLGISCEFEGLSVDPVMPAGLDGLHVRLRLYDRFIDVRYTVRAPGHGVSAVSLNEQPLSLTFEANPYRRGAARIDMREYRRQLREDGNMLSIVVG
jgi:cellobiose phosphorylase